MRQTRLMVMAGGTGGHVFPALAVAKQLRDAGTEVTWLGTKRGLESTVIPANDIAIEWVSIDGLRGKGGFSLLLAPLKLARAMWQSAAVIRRVQPDCILGMGGFVSGPGGLVARLMGRSLVVHEQNAVAGLTNKYLAKLANRVLTGFANVEGLPASARWVGNPVREAIQPNHTNSSNKLNVLIIGGSQGAHSFNLKLPSVFSAIAHQSVSIWHQSGRGRDTDVVALYKANGVNAKVSEFIEDMASAYAWADLLICRAGAMTIAECCAAAKPALLVPYPFSAGDHQQKNALTMVNVGAGKMSLNHQIDTPEFSRELVSLLSDKAVLRLMGQQAYTLHKPNALRDVVAICQEYLDA
ncbi:MAG: UDP-N-acetylglucosamine--N-acetylmuramyl-(pentapeptide) pyrophosphoryl-undecaprenol N-acetylglucosamine transferase [Arenicella sp.]|jgi:UDP-N-acetylglucosamine--N-acetylmuramyl-(pentapeptide) pyrophosphoryl-undecaprenol N-acetylglucosamine transferase